MCFTEFADRLVEFKTSGNPRQSRLAVFAVFAESSFPCVRARNACASCACISPAHGFYMSANTANSTKQQNQRVRAEKTLQKTLQRLCKTLRGGFQGLSLAVKGEK